jgi:hypothetical protein
MNDRSFLPPPAAAARFLAVDGLANARDLGGIACGDGRTTPTGVFRSGNVDQVTENYLVTARRGDERAAASGRTNDEPASEALCRTFGTTTEGAFRWALAGPDLPAVLAAAGLTDADLAVLRSWRQGLAD